MSKLLKRGLSLLMVLCMILAVVPVTGVGAADGQQTVYLQPGPWNVDGARFAARWWNDSGEVWLDMTDPNGDGVYECVQPDGMTKVIFCRMNGSTTDNEWVNCWNQSADLEFSASAGDCYTVNGWSSGDGYWSVYTYVEPVFIVAGSDALCTSYWSPTDESNRMTDADGDYTYTKSYAQVAAGTTYEIKIVRNGTDWFGDSEGQNVIIELNEVSDVTVSFNAATNEISYTTGHSYVDGVCTICGAADPNAVEPGYVLVTNVDDITAGGQFVIVANNDAYKALDTTISSKITAVDVTVSGNVVTGGELPVWTIEAAAGGVALSVNGTYLAYSSSTNFKSSTTTYTWGVTAGSNGGFVFNSAATSRGIYYQISGGRFGAYSTSNASNSGYISELLVFKYVESGTPEAYTITFVDEDGTVLSEQTVAPGAMPTIPADPTKAADSCTVYTFAGWDKEIVAAAGNATYTATYSEDISHTNIITDEVVEPGCESTGLTEGSHCEACGTTIVEQEEVPAAGHNYVDGICTGCGGVEVSYTGRYYIATIRTSGNYWYMTNDLGTGSTKRYQAVDSGLTALPAEITNPIDSSKVFVLEKNADGTYRIYAEGIEGDAKYLGHTSGNSGILVEEDDALSLTVDYTDDGYNIHYTASDAERYLALNGSTGNNYFAWYKSGQKQNLTLIPVTDEVVNTYTLTITYQGIKTEYELAYGEALPAIATDPIVTEDGKYTFWYWADLDAEHIARVDELPKTMPAKDLNYEAMLLYTGWEYDDGERQYLYGQMYSVTGWWCIDENNEVVTDGSGSWYYFDEDTHNAATGLVRVPYPTEAINGITYGPNAEDLANADKYGYTDATTSLFVFGEDGKFDQFTGPIRNEDNSVVLHYAINGQLPWHIGFVQVGSHLYYFIGENEKAVGDTYVSRAVNVSGFVMNGVYTFGEDGNMCRYDGITEMSDGTLRYYDNGQLLLGAGLVKLEDGNYIYVYSNGELAVDTEYWVAETNGYDIVAGMYTFDENGMLLNPVAASKSGVYAEDNGLFYYENGKRVYKGLIQHTGNGYENAWIYVRSNGQLAIGRYWITTTNGHKEAGYYEFDENGILQGQKNGIVDGYYYKDGVIAYNAGVIEIDGSYYYVRSNGQVVMNRSYWITNVGDSGVVQGNYTFDENGIMLNPETEVKDGIVNGYYYDDGSIAYAAGLIEIESGKYIYVRSNGQLATGRYWITNHNGVLEEGLYDFGDSGILIVE